MKINYVEPAIHTVVSMFTSGQAYKKMNEKLLWKNLGSFIFHFIPKTDKLKYTSKTATTKPSLKHRKTKFPILT
ncbi:hypothetical protein ZONE111904_04790 [Zobellia nedashkovskayae]